MMLIAEAGNNHFGDFAVAKEMVAAAHDSGAHAVKFQAFLPKDLIGRGSMPTGFYEKASFRLDQYHELISYGDSVGIPVFFSIFSSELRGLANFQKYHKVSAKQTVAALECGDFVDSPRTFVSFPKTHLFRAGELKHATPLYATDYLPDDPELYRLEYLAKLSPGRFFGYSDHTIGTRACEVAVKTYGASVIEKHFTMQTNLSFGGVVFRDTIHGATPKEFRSLSHLLKV